MSENESQELIEKKKKGRKPTSNNYFDEREENAVRLFLVSEDAYERNKIYNEYLRGPLDKMISSIIEDINYIVKIWISMKFIMIPIHF
jgi:hypothetical protein